MLTETGARQINGALPPGLTQTVFRYNNYQHHHMNTSQYVLGPSITGDKSEPTVVGPKTVDRFERRG